MPRGKGKKRCGVKNAGGHGVCMRWKGHKPPHYFHLKGQRPVTIGDVVDAAQKEGIELDVRLEPKRPVPRESDHGIDCSHYRQGKIQPIDVVRDWGLGFSLSNAVMYIGRAGKKATHPARGPTQADELADLKKALWYLEERIRELGGKP